MYIDINIKSKEFVCIDEDQLLDKIFPDYDWRTN